MKTALELMKVMLTSIFVEKNTDKAASFLTDDIHCYGLAYDRTIKNIHEIYELAESMVYEPIMKCELSLSDGETISVIESQSTATLGFSLKKNKIEIHYRLTGWAREEEGCRKLCLLQVSLLTARHSRDIFSDIARENVKDLQKELLSSSIAGGMMGGYIEAGFPFYYINQRMLDYLGYKAEADFIEDNSGMIENCMYPDDRGYVDRETRQQITGTGEYTIEYRMRKQDGSYIWVHDVGKKVLAEDGRDAIMSVCYDITEQRSMERALAESNNMLRDLLTNVECGICVCRWNGQQQADIQYFSEGFCRIYEGSKEELLSLYNQNTMFGLHPEDAPVAENIVFNIIKTRIPGECTYRSQTIRGTWKWITMKISVVKDGDGLISYATYFDVTEQMEVQQMLKQSEQMTEAACDFADLWIWTYDIKKDAIYCYKKMRNDFDLPELLQDYPKSWLDLGFITEETVSIYEDGVRAIKTGKRQAEFDCKMKYLDGSEHWVRCRFNRLSEEDNDREIAICTCQPIDDKKQLEAQIEMEQKKPSLGDETLLAYYVVNLSQNQAVEHVYMRGVSPIETPRLTIEDERVCIEATIYSEEEKAVFHRIHNAERMLRRYACGVTEETLDYRRIFSDGKVKWVRNVIHLLRSPETGEIFNYEYCYDIHARKMLEEVMSAAANYDYERFGSVNLINEQITMIYNKNERGTMEVAIDDYTTVSETYCREFVIPEDQEMFRYKISMNEIRRQLEDNHIYEFTHRIQEGGEIHTKRNRFIIYDTQSQIALMTRSDITEVVERQERKRKELTTALNLAEQATRAKTDFLSRMSHEIRTPMNAIMGMTTIAKENLADFEQVSDCLDKIDMSSQYLLTLINDILEMSRIESGTIDISHLKFDFDFLMKSIQIIAETLAKKECVRYVYLNEAKADSHYIGDMMRIQQVLVNILSNAIKFTKVDGKVRFSVSIVKETEAQALFQFDIADTGIGMSEEFMTRMFEPFVQENSGTTSEYSGSGLGLAISKSLVEAMNGTIEVDSFEGVGTTVTIEIPLKKTNFVQGRIPAVPDKPMKTEAVKLDGYRILLAEDHPLNIMVATRLLETKNAVVTVAEDGKCAVEKFRESTPGYYDAILMDIRMPVMDGLDATRTIRKIDRSDAKSIPIIAMTANALDEDRKRSQEAGMNAHLAKPFKSAQLYQTLMVQIQEARNGEE